MLPAGGVLEPLLLEPLVLEPLVLEPEVEPGVVAPEPLGVVGRVVGDALVGGVRVPVRPAPVPGVAELGELEPRLLAPLVPSPDELPGVLVPAPVSWPQSPSALPSCLSSNGQRSANTAGWP